MKLLFFLLFFICYSVASVGQSSLIEKDGFLYTNTILYSEKDIPVLSLIDTGCSLCVIDSTFVSKNIVINSLDSNYVLINSNNYKVSFCVIDSLFFCGKKYQNVKCFVADLKGKYRRYAPEFIIGAEILKDRILKFDRYTKKIEPLNVKCKEKGDVYKWKDWKSFGDIPYESIVFECEIDKEKYNFIFDSGSKKNKLPRGIQFADYELVKVESANLLHSLSIQEQRVYKNTCVKIAGRSNCLDFYEGQNKYGQLNLDLLNGHSFVLNYSEKKLIVLPY